MLRSWRFHARLLGVQLLTVAADQADIAGSELEARPHGRQHFDGGVRLSGGGPLKARRGGGEGERGVRGGEKGTTRGGVVYRGIYGQTERGLTKEQRVTAQEAAGERGEEKK